ncbi:MAG: tetratricopeptide repeat protein [Bacteroidaceae bacterium]|nr:tetratricopeptide repeat protein [Bacteroidaceae bacterium]
MKKVLLPIIASLLLICSCHRRPVYPPQFLVADSLASVQPDSAIALLEALKADSPQWDKATQMYHKLLTVKAHDKAFITHTSDSLMLSVLNYYEHGGDKRLLPEAYYYMGSTYRDMNDAPRALEYYQKALEVLPEGASPLRRYVNNQMGWLFYRQKLYDEALSHYQQSYTNDSIMEDKAEMASDLRNAGYIFRCKDNFEAALDTYYQAKEILADLNDTTVLDEVDTQIASLLLALGNNDEAKRFIMLPLKRVTRSSISNVYSIAAKAYLRIGQIDSAIYYYNELLKYGNIYGRQVAYEQLSLFAIKDKRFDDAICYTNMFKVLTDSIQSITATESLAQMNSLYNYKKALEEREAIIERNNANRWIIFLLCLSFTIIILIVWISFKRIKHRKAAIKEKLEEMEQEREMMRIDNEHSLAEMRAQIEDLENQLDSIGKENAQLSNMIVTQQRMIRSQLLVAEEKLIQNNNLDDQLKKSKLYAHIINLINRKNKKLSGKDFEELKKLYEEVAPDFMEKLMGLCKYNDIELQVTLLRRMGITPTDIAFLTNYVKSKISNVRSDLFKRVTGEKGRASQWDEYVYNL